MKLHTCINIPVDLLVKLDIEAKRNGIESQELAVAILHSYANNSLPDIKIGVTIKYQAKGEKYQKLYFRLDLNDYEFFLDLRKLTKHSVSKLYAMALIWYFSFQGRACLEALSVGFYGVKLDENLGKSYEWKFIWIIHNKETG